MYLLGIGLVLLALKYFAIDPVSNWSWWTVLAPFALAVLWWSWADSSGYTKRIAMERDQKRRQTRIDKQREFLHGTKRRR